MWGRDEAQRSNSVKEAIRRLRQKIEPDPLRPRLILTRRGTGYYLANP